jgi:hypothetical protein
MWGFLGTKIGQRWHRNAFDSSFDVHYNSWTQPEFTFPIFVGGTKIFFTEQWAFVPQLRYERTKSFYGNTNLSNTGLFIGIGLSVFF